jgi:hypothetical protein
MTRAPDPAVNVRVQKQPAELHTPVRCIFTSNLPQRLPVPGLDYPFDGLAENCDSHRSRLCDRHRMHATNRISRALDFVCAFRRVRRAWNEKLN